MPVYTRLKLSAVTIPAWSDFELTENVNLISQAADIRRTVNGEAVNVARSTFRKFAINISVKDAWAAGVSGIDMGSYCEVIPSEPFSISVPGGATSVSLPRAGVEVIGLDADGEKVQPTAQPASPLPLQTARSGPRIATLRIRPTVTFPRPVTLVRFRPVLACIVMDWSTSSDERAATASWNLSLEEI